MVIFPVFIRRATESTKKHVYEYGAFKKITRIDFKVMTKVVFEKQQTVIIEDLAKTNTKTFIKLSQVDETSYGFMQKVSLTEKEYRQNFENIEEYVCRKTRVSEEHQAMIKQITEKEPGRNYKAETYLVNDPDGINMNI